MIPAMKSTANQAIKDLERLKEEKYAGQITSLHLRIPLHLLTSLKVIASIYGKTVHKFLYPILEELVETEKNKVLSGEYKTVVNEEVYARERPYRDFLPYEGVHPDRRKIRFGKNAKASRSGKSVET